MKKFQVIKGTKIKSHSIRNSFRAEVWGNSDRSEKGLIMSNEICNCNSIKTTNIYLGIREKEIMVKKPIRLTTRGCFKFISLNELLSD
ncbi:MAG: hypothetical protein ABSD71_05385 [Bacteroidales bacterium]